MNRNQKIALGCGGAGCLGLIVLAVIGVLGYWTYTKNSSLFANQNENSNLNFNTNLNSNDSSSANSNTAADDGDDASSSMSEDDKHKLFQAASATNDPQLFMKVLKKIGFASGTGEGYEKFSQEHFTWALKNLEFIQSVNTPEKGRAYVEAHIGE